MSKSARRAMVALLSMVLAVSGMAVAALPAHAAAPLTSPDGLWTWVRPLPMGYPAGAGWPPDAPSWVGADAIAAAAPDTLYVATTQNDLLETTDGGTSWAWSRTSAAGGFQQPESVDFTSPSEGWAAGLDASGENALVLHTTDAGATWQPSTTVPGITGLPGLAWVDVRFTDPSSGFVVTGAVASCTTDGGATWSSPAALPTGGGSDASDLDAFAPSAPATAVCVETGEDIAGSNGTHVYRTTDGGATWTETATLKGEQDVTDVAFSSPQDGWATGWNYLWHTTDGGTSWQRARSNAHGGTIEAHGQDVWIVGGSAAIRSTDGGTTWTTMPVSASSVSFADSEDGWVTEGALYQHTIDGGATWTKVTPGTPTEITSLSAVPGGTVWGVAGPSAAPPALILVGAAGPVVLSSDGGQQWRRATSRGVAAVSAISARQAWAVGRKGVIIHTADGGHHWTLQASHITSELDSVDFVDALHGWAGGVGGVILYTRDGGRHWHVTREAKGGNIQQLSFADPMHGMALGVRSGGFLVTQTGGRTWRFEPDSALAARAGWPATLLMEDASHALVVSVFHNQCFASSDGGTTWQPAGAIPGGSSYGGIAHSGTRLCAVGFYGVATSSEGGATWSHEGTVMGHSLSSVQFVGPNELMISGSLGVMTRDLTTAPLP